MDIFDQILENLELERELGTRTVEFDRALLLGSGSVPAKPVAAAPVRQEEAVRQSVPQRKPATPAALMTPSAPSTSAAPATAMLDIAFLTGAPLSSAGMEAMRKTVAYVEKLRPGVRVGVNEGRQARVIVLLGSDAMRAHAPNVRQPRGRWFRLGDVPAVLTFSPDEILTRFASGSAGMNAAKRDLGDAIKSALGRLG